MHCSTTNNQAISKTVATEDIATAKMPNPTHVTLPIFFNFPIESPASLLWINGGHMKARGIPRTLPMMPTTLSRTSIVASVIKVYVLDFEAVKTFIT